jgi:hypothetical protein
MIVSAQIISEIKPMISTFRHAVVGDRGFKSLAECIKRARTDIPVHDADGAERQNQQAAGIFHARMFSGSRQLRHVAQQALRASLSSERRKRG